MTPGDIMEDHIIVKAKIKEYAKVDGQLLNVTGDFHEALAKKVIQMIEDAANRAKANSRNTVMQKDL